MNIKRKLKAFTLSEMLVVLVLTAIVVGIAFSVLTLVQRQMNGMQNTLEDGTRFRQLRQQLAVDFNEFHEIKYISQDSSFVFSHPMDSVTYNIENNTLIRELDTFKVSLSTFNIYNNGIEIIEGKVDAIKLNTFAKDYQRDIFLYKIQDAETLMR